MKNWGWKETNYNVKEFLKMGKFKELKSYSKYKEAFNYYDKLEKSLTQDQERTLFLFKDTYFYYNELYLNEFADFLISHLKKLYCK